MLVENWYQFLSLDTPAILTAVFAAVSCALLGNFLVLRRLSLMGDTISHAVLPGIVVAFLISSSRSALPIFIGAIIAGIVTAVLVELVRKLGRVESGAAMGVVFSILFAMGVLLMEQASARHVDLDADCLLHGQLETIFWYPPETLAEFFSTKTLSLIPSELLTSFVVMLLTIVFVTLLFKELTLAAFDPGLATSLGFNANILHYLLMIFVAFAVVASFEAVGSILVIAMIICPAATARLLTDKLPTQILLSVAIAIITAVAGYAIGAFAPPLVGWKHSVNTAGMMTVVAGILLASSAIFAPHYGIVGKLLSRLRLQLIVTHEDLLGLLYRIEESPQTLTLTKQQAFEALGNTSLTHKALRHAQQKNEISIINDNLQLTPTGKQKAKSLIRTHRLWESYLVNQLGLSPDHVHQTATELEHFTSSQLSEKIASKQQHPQTDPHGKPIPS